MESDLKAYGIRQSEIVEILNIRFKIIILRQ